MQGIPQGQGSENRSQNLSGSAQKPTLSWQTPAVPAASKQVVTPTKSDPVKPITPAVSKSVDTNKDSPMLMYVIIFIAGLILGTLLGTVISRGVSGTSTTTESETNTQATGATSANAGAVDFDLSQSAGRKVVLSKVSVSKPTWILVYDDVNGVPGRSLGATLFFPASEGGETSGTIDLLRSTVAGHTYLVGQLEDDGDYLLSFQKDKAVLGANGTQILTTLSVK